MNTFEAAILRDFGEREDFERAIDLAPSIKPFRHTYLHEEKYRRLAKEILWEDETLKRVFEQEK